MSSIRTVAVLVVMLGALGFLQYRLWFQKGGIRDMVALKKSIAEQRVENDKLKAQNHQLLAQVKRMQNSKDAVESRARSELGMVKKGETFYHVVK